MANPIGATKAEISKLKKKAKADGAKFEKKVREHYEAQGWVVSKWRNNIENGEIIPARNYYIPGRGNVMGSGFPDFVMFRKIGHWDDRIIKYEMRLVEAKLNGLLTKEEKLKLKVLKELGHTTYIAYKDESQPNGIRLREYVYSEGNEKIPRGHK